MGIRLWKLASDALPPQDARNLAEDFGIEKDTAENGVLKKGGTAAVGCGINYVIPTFHSNSFFPIQTFTSYRSLEVSHLSPLLPMLSTDISLALYLIAGFFLSSD